MRKGLAALALVFLAAHLPFLPDTLEDIDSINFALGVRNFDVAHHQPHPPGYPVFIGISKVSTAVLCSAGVAAPEARGLAVWSAVSGTALIWFLFTLFRSLGGGAGGTDGDRARDRLAACATLIAVTSPLFWFTSLRPLSDMAGLAGAVSAQALIVSFLYQRAGRAALMWAGFLAGLAIGIRSQTFLLTLPLLAAALLPAGRHERPGGATLYPGLRMRDRAAVVAATGLGVFVWAIPLIWASGGLASYAAALGTQAGEDFSGVVMLWNVRSARVAVDALLYSFLWPWGGLFTGAVVVAIAAAGAVRVAWQRPRIMLLLLVGFVPYAIFHLLFHEVVTVRYALPLIVPVAYLAATALEGVGRTLLPVGAVALASVSLVPAVSASVAYARDGSPAFRAFRAVERAGGAAGGFAGGAIDAVGMHAVARRVAQWEGAALPGRVLEARHGREWLALVAEWRSHPQSSVAFVADPRRTDLALIDPRSRQLVEAYRWGFIEPPFVGGARPGNSDLYRMSPPRWMLDRGWALGAEVAGVTARDELGPHRQPSVAWVRASSEEMLLMLGGRHLGAAGDPKVRLSLRVNGRPLSSFAVRPGFFFNIIPVAAGTFAASGGYMPLEVTAEAAKGGTAIPVALEQFDLQAERVPMIGVEEGWQEPEYNATTARAWRWAAERSTLWVRPIGRDVTLVLEGESPLRYFDSAPAVTVTVAGRQVARFSPSADFRQAVILPADALAAADGRIVVESDKSFVPGERDGTADKRRLALRIYSYSVR